MFNVCVFIRNIKDDLSNLPNSKQRLGSRVAYDINETKREGRGAE